MLGEGITVLWGRPEERETRATAASSEKERGREKLAYGARHADQLRHGCITAGSDGSAIFAQGRSDGVLAAVLVFDLEKMLEELEKEKAPCVSGFECTSKRGAPS